VDHGWELCLFLGGQSRDDFPPLEPGGQGRAGQDRTAHVSHICSFNLLLIFFKNEGFKLLKFSMNIRFYKKNVLGLSVKFIKK
jgi:hypothetical protein